MASVTLRQFFVHLPKGFVLTFGISNLETGESRWLEGSVKVPFLSKMWFYFFLNLVATVACLTFTVRNDVCVEFDISRQAHIFFVLAENPIS